MKEIASNNKQNDWLHNQPRADVSAFFMTKITIKTIITSLKQNSLNLNKNH